MFIKNPLPKQLTILDKLVRDTYEKELWAFILILIVVIATVSAILILLSSNSAIFLLAIMITISASMLVTFAGYLSWRSLASKKLMFEILGSVDATDSAVAMTDRTDSIIFSNTLFEDYFGVFRDHFKQKFNNELVHA